MTAATDPETMTAWDARVRGRTAAEIEADVLVAMLAESDVRAFGCAVLRSADFTVARHRAIFRNLHFAPTGTLPDATLARALGERPADVVAWRLAAAPLTPKPDIALLVERR